jgi:allantoicase
MTPVEAGTNARFDIPDSGGPITHIRLDLHPDGAIGRLRVFGSVEPGDSDES